MPNLKEEGKLDNGSHGKKDMIEIPTKNKKGGCNKRLEF
jgi:hypothetical protein